MRKQTLAIGITGLALIGACAGFLSRFDGRQHLGRPGVKVVPGTIHDEHGKVAGTNMVFLPEDVLDFKSSPSPISRQELDWLPKDTTYGRRRYTSPGGHFLDVSVVLMGTDRTSIHKPEYCLPGQGFGSIDTEATAILIDKPHPYRLPVKKMTATKTFKTADGQTGTVRAVYVYWFVADDQITASHVERMWWMARDLVRAGTLQRWAYIGCLTVCYPGQEEAAFERIKRFISAAVPEFQLADAAVDPTSAP